MSFYLWPTIFEYQKNDTTVLEQSPLGTVAKQGQLMAYEHSGYWQCMDTIRDRDALRGLWGSGKASWLWNSHK